MVQVLVVDDDLQYLDAISGGLTALGHEVTTAASGIEALTLLQTQEIDIAIFDMIMAGGGAVTLLHEVRNLGLDFPIIVITGRSEIASSPLFQKGMRNATARIEKSATLPEIGELIRSLLAK